MEEKETVILDFQVKDDQAIQQMVKVKQSILDLKAQQKLLNDEYKKTGDIEKYSKAVVSLENQLKKQTSAYSTLQKQVTGVKSSFDKLSDSIKANANQATIGGVSVGQLGAKIAGLANPVTAAVSLVGALGAAYASSTIGAKDLEFASNQLSAATSLLTNQFASLISSSEDGQGFFSRLTDGIINSLSPGLAAASKGLAAVKEEIQDLQRDEIAIRGDINERLAENAELLAKVQDSQTKYEDKVALTSQAILNLRKNESDLLGVKEKQLSMLQNQLAADTANEDLQTAVLEKEKEISRVKSDTERKVSGIVKLESNLNDELNKQLQTERDLQAARGRAGSPGMQFNESEIQLQTLQAKSIDQVATLDGLKKRLAKTTLDQTHANMAYTESQDKSTQSLLLYANATGTFSQAFERQTIAYKLLASAQAVISTYLAADEVLSSPQLVALFPANIIAAGITVAAGLASVAKINGVEFSEGGYTGAGGKYQPAGLVHAGEVVWNQRDVAAVGGPGVANAMRPSYADGGIVARGMSGKVPQMPNFTMPQMYLAFKEFREFEGAINHKEAMVSR